MIARGALVCGGLWLAGCGVFLPDGRTPADRARALVPKCRAEVVSETAAAIAPTAIDSVEPYYVTLPSSSGHENRMLGARLHTRALPGATSESLARALQCHQAAVVRGETTTDSNDPYVLPASWVQIDVSSEGNGFVVSVYPADFQNAAQVLERARRYVSER